MTKNLKNNSFFYILLCILGLGGSCLIGQYLNIEHQAQTTNSDLENTQNVTPEYFLELVDSIMTNTWSQLKAQANITQEECDAYLVQYGEEIKAEIKKGNEEQAEHMGPVSPSAQSFIKEILDECGVNIDTIDIVAMYSPGSPALADDYTIFIDEKTLKTLSPEAQRFIIAHEISHLKNRDSSYATALTNLLNKENSAHKACIDLFSRSIEIRADIHAMLRGKTFAQGAITAYQEYIKQYGNTELPSHPLPSDRLKMAQDMLALYTI